VASDAGRSVSHLPPLPGATATVAACGQNLTGMNPRNSLTFTFYVRDKIKDGGEPLFFRKILKSSQVSHAHEGLLNLLFDADREFTLGAVLAQHRPIKRNASFRHFAISSSWYPMTSL